MKSNQNKPAIMRKYNNLKHAIIVNGIGYALGMAGIMIVGKWNKDLIYGFAVGAIVGFLTSPIYGPFYFGNTRNYFTHIISALKIDQHVMDLLSISWIPELIKGIIASLVWWFFLVCYALIIPVVGVLWFKWNGAVCASITYVLTMFWMWSIMDNMMAIMQIKAQSRKSSS